MKKERVEVINTVANRMIPIVFGIHEGIERMLPTLSAISVKVEIFLKQYLPVIQRFAETNVPKIADFVRQAKNWQEERKITVTVMAERGWFPNWYTFFFNPKEKYDDLDDFMIAHINQCWDDLKKNIIDHCPKRKHILEVAFSLHEQGNYIASIPLLLTQSDGICSEEFTHFFTKDYKTGKKASDEIIHQAERNELTVNFFSEILLEPFKVNLQITQGSSKASKTSNKAKGPNRHGIIHGSRKHLDYGSAVNGYKAISFLAFIVFTVKSEFQKQESQNDRAKNR